MATITWGNKGSIAQQQINTTEAILAYLESYINSFLARPINWDISINIDANVPTENGNSDFVFFSKDGNKNLWLTNGAYQEITGIEKTGFDAKININPKYLTEFFG